MSDPNICPLTGQRLVQARCECGAPLTHGNAPLLIPAGTVARMYGSVVRCGECDDQRTRR